MPSAPSASPASTAPSKPREAAGLYVVLTCRSGPGRANFDESFEIWHDEAAQAAYVQMWRKIAEHYRGRSSIVGYDLMCEPHPEKENEPPSGAWNKLAKRITAAIREVDPQTPIVVNSAGYGYPQRFADLEPTGDPRTVYSVHFYSPRHYTHQKPDAPVSYPGVVAKHVEPEQYWDANTIEKTLAPVRAFQEKYQVPIFAGEFGCSRWAPGATHFFRDEMRIFDKWGWSSAYWALREWDAMDIEMLPVYTDRTRYPHTPLLNLFQHYFAQDRVFLPPSGKREPPHSHKYARRSTPMAWCPNCRTEYRPQFTHCADCGAELVESLPPEPELEPHPTPPYEKDFEEVLLCAVRGESHLALIRQALAAEGIPSRESAPDARDLGFVGALRQFFTGIYVNRRDEARAREIYETYEGTPP